MTQMEEIFTDFSLFFKFRSISILQNECCILQNTSESCCWVSPIKIGITSHYLYKITKRLKKSLITFEINKGIPTFAPVLDKWLKKV